MSPYYFRDKAVGEGTLNAGNSRSCSLVRSSTNLTDTSVSGSVKVDILTILVVYERECICLGKRYDLRSMGEGIARASFNLHLVAW